MSAFGGFWDSVIDRFSDIALFIGLIYLYSQLDRTDYVMIAALAMMFAMMTSYTRARAESLIPKCKVGFMERPERIVLFMIGAFTNRMAAVLWVILVLSIFTVADRIILTYRELRNAAAGRGVKNPATLPGPDPLERVLLDLRTRHVAVRPDGHRHPGVRLADAAGLAERPEGVWLRARGLADRPAEITSRSGSDVVALVVHAEVERLAGEMDVVRGDLVAQQAPRRAVVALAARPAGGRTRASDTSAPA